MRKQRAVFVVFAVYLTCVLGRSRLLIQVPMELVAADAIGAAYFVLQFVILDGSILTTAFGSFATHETPQMSLLLSLNCKRSVSFM